MEGFWSFGEVKWERWFFRGFFSSLGGGGATKKPLKVG